MKNRWSDTQASRFIRHGRGFPRQVSLGAYASGLLAQESELVLPGGGNSSVKDTLHDVMAEPVSVLFVKGSGKDMAGMGPADFVPTRLDPLLRLRYLKDLSDEDMAKALRMAMLEPGHTLPSVETLVHAFMPAKVILHTHPAPILALTNRDGARKTLRQALGDEVALLPYVRPGFDLAMALADLARDNPLCRSAVLLHHGLISWGDNAKEAYRDTVLIVGRAQRWIASHKRRSLGTRNPVSPASASREYRRIAPLIRGVLGGRSCGDMDRPFRRVVLSHLADSRTLRVLSSPMGKKIACSAPLTPDYLIRIKAYPLCMDNASWDNAEKFHAQLSRAVEAYSKKYARRLEGHVDCLPKVLVIPKIGVVCVGRDHSSAELAARITRQGIDAKASIHETGGRYRPLSDDHLQDMETHLFQQAKLSSKRKPLIGSVAVVTGAAGAIGTAIARALLQEGCHVALTDLGGRALQATATALEADHPGRVAQIPMDVTDKNAVGKAFATVVQRWGGIDLLVANAGAAHVSALADLELEDFQKLERVNSEGTLLVLREAARWFGLQRIGGDIVVISTKNVFSPGAQFGAYSATKASSHQLARIASLELAQQGVRVNMVAPDAVFSDGAKQSGLWKKVGPSRMRARGLDSRGLQAYYRNRNLLKARVTADHVARAVLFFATRQTPTTGATLPVDGGLPEATPR